MFEDEHLESAYEETQAPTVEDDEDDEVDEEFCEYMIYAETRVDPAEYCDEPAVPGQTYCVRHLELIESAYSGYVNQ